MDVLIQFGFSVDEINNILNTNQDIVNANYVDIKEIINLLISVGCLESHIKNIIISNPFILTEDILNIKRIITRLQYYDFTHLEIFFESNPFFLLMDINELNRIFSDKVKEGLSNEQIRDYFYYQFI